MTIPGADSSLTPAVVDLQQEVAGRVVAVTPAFCVFEVEGALCVSPWRDV